jgi:hypothetical protein
MNGKFFLFKRDSPNKDSEVFSDNGKGLSLVAIPASSVSYMAGIEGSISIFFNDTSLFEENSLREGESFEKTKVSVACAVGEEDELMEAVINFINRDTPNNFMRFDATGERNTFRQTEVEASVDAFIRSRPVRRGVTGNAAIQKTNNLTILDGLDFLSLANLPIIDFSHTALGVARSDIASMANHSKATGGSTKNASITSGSTKISPIVAAPDAACSTKTIDLAAGKLIENTNVSAGTAGTFNTDEGGSSGGTSDAATMRLIRQGVYYSVARTLELIQLPSFDDITTNASHVVTQMLVNDEGGGLRPNDIISFELTGNSLVGYLRLNDFLGNSDGSGGFRPAKLEFEDINIDNDYTIYATVVIPPNALTQPIYDGDSASSTEAKGLFPRDSLGDEFEISHQNSSTFPSTKFKAIRSTFPFKQERFPMTPVSLGDALTAGYTEADVKEPLLTSEDNLHCFVIRRTKDREIVVYDRKGEVVATKAPGLDTDGKLNIDNFGMVIGQDQDPWQQMRIARFGVVAKDIGDTLSRDIAVQMFETYRV